MEKTPNKTKKSVVLDAAGKRLGRFASEVAIAIRGKDRPEYQYHLDMGIQVMVKNIQKIGVSGSKMDKKKYYSYSGYQGGLKEKTMREKFNKNPQQFFIDVVYNMLPDNRLRSRLVKRIKFI